MSENKEAAVIDVTPEPVPETFEQKAERLLSRDDWRDLQKHKAEGQLPLSPSTVASFFELYLNGSDVHEIAKLNPSFPKPAINLARIKYNWDIEKERAINELQSQIYTKVIKAQSEIVDLLTTMTTVVHKKNSYKYKKYLQTGNEKELKGAIDIGGVNTLLRIIEGLQKVTGSDRIMKTKNENTFNFNVNKQGALEDIPQAQIAGSAEGNQANSEDFDSDDAAAILSVLANAKRKKNGTL